MGLALAERSEPSGRRKPPRRTQGGGQKNSRRLAEVRAATIERRSAPLMRADPYDVLQETVDGYVADLRFTQRMVDRLSEEELWRDTLVGRIPNEWIRLRDEYRERLTHIGIKLAKVGLADRAIKVQEAQTALLAQRVRAAADRAGLTPTQVRALGAALRELSEEER